MQRVGLPFRGHRTLEEVSHMTERFSQFIGAEKQEMWTHCHARQ